MKIILLLIIATFSITAVGQKPKTSIVKEIPNIKIFDLSGSKFDLAEISKNKVTLIDFWFIPCGPCFVEMNMLHKIYSDYKSNNNFNFITITFSDSSFVRDLIENHNTDSNDVYDYFKKLAKLDTFKLPVYFVDGYMTKSKRFKKGKNGIGYAGANWPNPTDNSSSPDLVFGFRAFPTILIFNKKGHLVFNKTGFTDRGGVQEIKEIKKVIESGL